MTVVSVREVTPQVGKEKLVESRMRRAGALIANIEHTRECIRQ